MVEFFRIQSGLKDLENEFPEFCSVRKLKDVNDLLQKSLSDSMDLSYRFKSSIEQFALELDQLDQDEHDADVNDGMQELLEEEAGAA